ncbi:hypothetical protein [Paenibacillus spongiae]|uniref:Neutral/alkaline non-lysosomal ceramidase N-terminal domain-containing protein n=1 Tax=Paenibacillus spongiae TaxID=2909671 RepID=A0ABY5SKK3_9BACL|nr:hypothetical protein [Paenibacillus spongiae]UVI33045.1 hypothetical protein L1F29_14920 [Paenibacillus spongiae]
MDNNTKHELEVSVDKGKATAFRQGWAQADITPDQPVQLAGQFHMRLSEGVLDPLSVTAWAIESGGEHAVFVCCDLVSIPDEFRDAVRARVSEHACGLNPLKVIIHATHTHTAPEIRTSSETADHMVNKGSGVDIEHMPIEEYNEFAIGRIVDAVMQAWGSRAPGAVAYGWGNAVICRNRRWVDADGNSIMYNLDASINSPFRHIEGYEDHSINLMATYDSEGQLTGLIINIPCPSQASEHLYEVSADWWCETREQLRSRFGENLYILPQCSAAGDLSPHQLLDRAAYERMLTLKGKTMREEIACQIADAVGDILPYIASTRDSNPSMQLHSVQLDLPANKLSEEDVRHAEQEAGKLMRDYEEELRKFEEQPELRNVARWYVMATYTYRRRNWYLNVVSRYEHQQTCSTLPAEIHVLQLGDVAFATVPYELYLDFGSQIKVRSAAKQTFLVQLAGAGTYLPSARSVAGGGYGSVPASNNLGPDSGQILADHISETIQALMGEGQMVK